MARNTAKAIKEKGNKAEDYSKLSVIIPAAGMGRRMKSYGAKGLIILNSQTVLERQIKTIWRIYPAAEITIVAGFEADLISERIRQKYSVRIIRNTDYKNTNVSRSIFLGLQSCTNQHALLIYGDLVFNSPTIKNLVGGGSKVVVDSGGKIKDEEVGALFGKGRVTHFSYAIDTKWCQIAYLATKEMKMFEEIASKRDHDRWFGYEVMNEIIDAGGGFTPVEPSGMKIAEIDSPRDLKTALEVAITSR
jgi:choline kinase